MSSLLLLIIEVSTALSVGSAYSKSNTYINRGLLQIIAFALLTDARSRLLLLFLLLKSPSHSYQNIILKNNVFFNSFFVYFRDSISFFQNSSPLFFHENLLKSKYYTTLIYSFKDIFSLTFK